MRWRHHDRASIRCCRWAVLIAALAGAGSCRALIRRARGTGWRYAWLGGAGGSAAQPVAGQEERQPIKDVAGLVVDDPSQNIGERRARTERALADLQERLARFPDLEVRVVRPAGAEGGVGGAIEETRLFEVLSAPWPICRAAGWPGGVHHRRAGPRRTGRGQGSGRFRPGAYLLTGERGGGPAAGVVKAPSFGLVGEPAAVTVRVEDMPGNQSPDAVVNIRQDGGAPRPFRVPVGRDMPLEFTLEHGGQNVFEMEVAAAPQELTLANNRAAVVINGVRDRLRVLLVSGEPHAGERTWRNLLKADPGVDLVHFTILRPPEKQDGTPIRELSLIAFPIRELFEIKLDEFDLIIFDRYRRRGVLPQLFLSNIASYVENGGALLDAGGASLATSMSLYRRRSAPCCRASRRAR